MPTTPAKARRLLRDGKAKVVKKEPFTIQLQYATGETKQEINLGVDAGSKIVGLFATTEKEELFSAEVELRNDIVKLLAQRKAYRRNRRSRKTRYRQARFLNRKKEKGWFAPSIQHKINTHLKVVADIHKILPVSKIIVEVASFDIQKIKNPDIQGEEYQQGDQLEFWNVREYVLWRDGHRCHGKKGCKNNILNVHHIESCSTGGNAPDNLITLCKECHKAYHRGELKLNLKRGKSFRDAAFMGVMRRAFYNKLKDLYLDVNLTYGYITKTVRIKHNLPKSHRIDALCIGGNVSVKPNNVWFYIKKIRNQNRRLHKDTILKGGYRKANKATKYVFGYKLFDKVLFNNNKYFILGRRNNGYFSLGKLSGEKITVSYKKIKVIRMSQSLLCERRQTA